MTFNGFVDVGIGLMLLYLLLSLLCTTLNELIQNMLSWRATSLSRALNQLIDDPALQKTFLSHGILQTTEASARGGHAADGSAQRMSYLDSRSFASALLDSLAKLKAAERKAVPTLADIEEAALKLNEGKIKDVLLASLADAKSDLETAKANVARWFDSAMDRLSGNYKRSAQKLSLLIGLLLAMALNADSISVGKTLWRDQTLRDDVVKMAVQTIERGYDSKRCKDVAQDASIPLTSDQIQAEATCLVEKAKTALAETRVFPIGWSSQEFRDIQGGVLGYVGWFFLKVLGLLWTAAALTLGATFWFDMLQKVMGLRGAGPKPASLSGAKPDAA